METVILYLLIYLAGLLTFMHIMAAFSRGKMEKDLEAIKKHLGIPDEELTAIPPPL